MKPRRVFAVGAALGLLVSSSSSGAWGFGDGTSRPSVPGAVDPNVTQRNIRDTICAPGYARSVRPPYSFTGPLKQRLMRREHPGERFGAFELDHLVPLSLGGAPSDPANLWLEPWTGPLNAGDKDALEYVLWRLVCNGEVPLSVAQHEIARDWISAYYRYATRENLQRYHFHSHEDE